LKLSRNLDLTLSFTFQPNISTGEGSSSKQQKFETMGFTYPIKKSFSISNLIGYLLYKESGNQRTATERERGFVIIGY
jgi:hypothetical protein